MILWDVYGVRMEWMEEACVPLPLDHFFFCFLAPVAAGAFRRYVSVCRGITCCLRGAVPFCRMWVVRGLEHWKSLLNINPCARSFSNVGRHVCALGLCILPQKSFNTYTSCPERQEQLTFLVNNSLREMLLLFLLEFSYQCLHYSSKKQ